MSDRRPIEEVIQALDSYDALDDVQRSLIERWAAGEDVNDMAQFEAPIEYADDEYNGVIPGRGR